MESEFADAKLDAIRFNDFIKEYRDISKIPLQYQRFMIMDILHLSKSEIDELGPIEYNEAFNYSIVMCRSRSMAISEKRKSGSGEIINFDQDPDFDTDPKFVSNIGRKID